MAKKKIKKPVSKRVKKTDAPKARKPRAKKPESVVTTEPAVKTLWREGSAEEFLADVGAAPTQTNTLPVPPVEYTKVRVPTRLYDMDDLEKSNSWISAITKFSDRVTDWLDDAVVSRFDKLKTFAFTYPLVFGIGFCAALTVIAVIAAALARYFRW
jgi:hypothetical protein